MRVPHADEPVEDPINITNTPGYIEDDADWSPDGLKIVFTRHLVSDNQMNSSTAEICVLDLETPDAEPQCLLGPLTNSEEERAPAWSPDGIQIAYMCRDPNDIFDICVMNADGTDQMHLTTDSLFEGTPSWSPDGKSILFGRGPTLSADLFVINLEDGTVTPVTDTAERTNLFPHWGELWVGGRGPQKKLCAANVGSPHACRGSWLH
jgi:Tol biopolymer transport system component